MNTEQKLREPESFESWNSRQQADPEEIGFLQALRIAYLAGQDSMKQALAEPAQEPVDKDGSSCSEFWAWLPKAYRDGDIGNEPKFTKYNMEVAFSAGKRSVKSNPDNELIEWLRLAHQAVPRHSSLGLGIEAALVKWGG